MAIPTPGMMAVILGIGLVVFVIMELTKVYLRKTSKP